MFSVSLNSDVHTLIAAYDITTEIIRLIFLCSIPVLLQGCSEAIVFGGMSGLIAYHDARTTKYWYQDQSIKGDNDTAEVDLNVGLFVKKSIE